jgi:hypothetical protein
VGKPEGKGSLGSPRRRPEDNIKIYLRDIKYNDMDWIHLAQDGDHWGALTNTATNFRVA